jgi:hypothetical protein
MHRVTHGKKEMELIVLGNHIRTTLKILWTKKDLKKSLTIFSAKNNFHSTTKQEDRKKSGIFSLIYSRELLRKLVCQITKDSLIFIPLTEIPNTKILQLKQHGPTRSTVHIA